MAGAVRAREHVRVDNLLSEQYEFLLDALASIAADEPDSERFSSHLFRPPWRVPALSDRLAEYFSASTMAVSATPGYAGRRIGLLDLTGNERTRTTKSFASLVMVARAVAHIERTGEAVTLLIPTSANKGTALRDAVTRAIETDLVRADQLNVVMVVPQDARGKLWSSPLSDQEGLAGRNPVAMVRAGRRDDVKRIAKTCHEENARRHFEVTGARLWYTLDVRNYKVADALRARFEYCYLPPAGPRLHVHAVSSAYGLLGHHFGAKLLGGPFPELAKYFLVQHLGTPDMILHLYNGNFSQDNIPEYRYDMESGLYFQSADPHFPFTTGDPGEFLESTFYTSAPPTSDEMTAIIDQQGGGGIVVSLHECLSRYPEVRALLAETTVHLPADPRELREWSLVMALTGLLTAIDRDILPEAEDILVHASGSYTARDFVPLPDNRLRTVTGAADLTSILFDASATCPGESA